MRSRGGADINSAPLLTGLYALRENATPWPGLARAGGGELGALAGVGTEDWESLDIPQVIQAAFHFSFNGMGYR
jgi:hypothetical protein